MLQGFSFVSFLDNLGLAFGPKIDMFFIILVDSNVLFLCSIRQISTDARKG